MRIFVSTKTDQAMSISLSFYRAKAAEIARRAEFAPDARERERLAAEARAWREIAEVEDRLATREGRFSESTGTLRAVR
jgi:hypothetical protein